MSTETFHVATTVEGIQAERTFPTAGSWSQGIDAAVEGLRSEGYTQHHSLRNGRVLTTYFTRQSNGVAVMATLQTWETEPTW